MSWVLGRIEVALSELRCGFVGALSEPCWSFDVAITWLSTRFEVALMSH
jgi:hypothetical protein